MSSHHVNPIVGNALLFAGVWLVAILGAGALNSVMLSDNPAVIRRGRVAFTLLLALELVWAPLKFEETHDMSRGLWWGIALGAGIPIALALCFTVRSAYTERHRIALISAFLATVALFLALPLGHVPPHEPLTGLGRFEHEHHVLDIVALLVPTLILLVSEALRGHVEGSEQEFSVLTRLRITARAVGVGGAVALAFFLWLLGASASTVVFGEIAAIVGFLVFVWWKDRSAVKRARRNLERG